MKPPARDRGEQCHELRHIPPQTGAVDKSHPVARLMTEEEVILDR